MRRKISLYIGDQLVDLDDQAFVLFNYQMDDLSNPAIVKNSFSQQITLKGTPTNNRVFGESFRLDRTVANSGGNTGISFNASQKTPFTIYNELSEVLQSGYVKLDSISRKGADIQYKVTLYGGLGSFFYSLSYDGNGNKRTLADLQYRNTSNPDSELDFVITKEAVQEAWERLHGDQTASELWDILNFAPMYNGIPEGNFSADKALFIPSEVGLRDTVTQDNVSYTLRSGYALASLAEKQEEWAVKDLRSYLQRPVLSMKAFWDAICNPANNGGYEVDASIIEDSNLFGAYANLWMTLPMISSIGSGHQASGLSLIMSTEATTGNAIGRFDISGEVPSGTKVTAVLNCYVRYNVSGADSLSELFRSVTYNYGTNTLGKMSAIFMQAVAYGSDDTIVGGSKIKVLGSARVSGTALAQDCGFVPDWIADYETISFNVFEKVENGVFGIPMQMGFTVEAQDVAYYKIMVHIFPGTSSTDSGSHGSTTRTDYGAETGSIPVLYENYETGYTPASSFIARGSASTISTEAPETLRSGAVVTKSMLLSSSHTPAEYMISFCKIFGLYFHYDTGTRKVTILRRNDLYQDRTIDLSGRVDLSKGVNIQPMVFNAKWYDFQLPEAGGAFAEEYEKIEGVPYAVKKVNTGYDFNADSVNLLESVVFKNGVTVQGKSKYYNDIYKVNGQNRIYQPSPFIDKGNKYTLWASTGETLETDISCPPSSAIVEYWPENETYKGYDLARRLEVKAADGKPVDGADILLMFEGWDQYPLFRLTDDVPAMDVLNDGMPCWILGAGSPAMSIPSFSRYAWDNTYNIIGSLDMGMPFQLDIPGARYPTGLTIYEKGWQNYMADRYDVNTKVMTCHVDLSGLQVNQDLLRIFWWFGGSLWVLNKITNYSLTTFDPVECEFVQVQDKDNYLTGQTY